LLAFVPLYILGLMGATRRLDHYDPSLGWQQLFIVAGVGVAVISLGVGLQILQVIVSIKNRHQNQDLTGDPWNGRTLEWATSSPPPAYNFAIVPQVTDRDAYWVLKHAKQPKFKFKQYSDIELPKNSPLPITIASLAFVGGFGLIWHIFWLAAGCLAGIITLIIIRSLEINTEYKISAAKLRQLETKRLERGVM
jgi:cytochrome o ubiquinol oxidase subunit 1